MTTIDLQKIIDSNKLSKADLANQLFPQQKHPVRTLTRVLKGEKPLGIQEINRLSFITGIPVHKLFEEGEWLARVENRKHIFTNGEYRAELFIDDRKTKLYKKGSLFHEEVLHSSAIPLSEYLESLNSIIKNQDGN